MLVAGFVLLLLAIGQWEDTVSPVHHKLQEGSVQEANPRRESAETALDLQTSQGTQVPCINCVTYIILLEGLS